MTSLVTDVQHATRALTARPMFFGAAVLSIAIGAGLNAGVYAVAHRVLFEDTIGAAAQGRLIRIQPGISFPNYRDLRQNELPIALAAMQMSTLNWQNGDDVRTVSGHVVSHNFFTTVGVTPVVGRTFTAADEDRDDLVVLTFSMWQRTFDSDPRVIGRTVQLNGAPYVIVGVLPGHFATNPLAAGVVYVPIGPRVSVALDNRRAAQFDLVGRLDDKVSRGEALAAIRVAAQRLERAFPEVNRDLGRRFKATSTDAFSTLRDGPVGWMVVAASITLYGLAALVLLIACANVAGLMLVRADERRRDIAVRIALGASRRRLVQHTLAESCVVGTIGCVVGMLLWATVAAVLDSRIAATGTVEVRAFSTSIPVIYAMVLVAIVTLTCGSASSLRMWRLSRTADVSTRPWARPSSRFRVQRALVTLQVAVCFVLLVAAACLAANVARLRIADAGFTVDHLMSVNVRVPPSSQARDQLTIRTAVESEAGVAAVSWGSPVGPPFSERLTPDPPQNGAQATVDIRGVGPRFFTTLQIPLVTGRDVTDADLRPTESVSVAVNEAFVRRYLPGVDPIGRRFVRGENTESARAQQHLTIVAVARDVMARTIGESRVPVVYIPQALRSLTIRVNDNARPAIAQLQHRVTELQPPGSVVTVLPFGDDIRAALVPVRSAAALLGVLGGIGLLLASAGLYAVVSYVAGQRTFEIGVRVALGATRAAIGRMVLGDALRVVVFGCLIGLAVSVVVGRFVQSAIEGQTVITPAACAVVTALLLIVGAGASLRPARRAAASDPVQALRQE
jgi:predicted permease